GMNLKSNAVANAVGVDAKAGAVGVVLQHVGTVGLARVVVDILVVRVRAHGNVHFLAVAGKDNIAGPMAAAGQASSTGQIGDYRLRRSTRLQIAHVIREAND